MVSSSYRDNFRSRCRGVTWSHSLGVLQLVAICTGGRLLARIFRALSVDLPLFSGGAPDLLMVRVRRKSVRLQWDEGSSETAAVKYSSALPISEFLGDENRLELSGLDNVEWGEKIACGGAGEWWREGRATRSKVRTTHELEGREVVMDTDERDAGVDVVQDESADVLPTERQNPFVCQEPELILPEGEMEQWEFGSMFVEVKGPTDSLAQKQLLWLRVLESGGANVFVCSVVEPTLKSSESGGRDSKRKRSSSSRPSKAAPYVRYC